MQAETQAELLALKSEVRQMKATMGSKIASIEKALMHGKNKTWSNNDKSWFWTRGPFVSVLCWLLQDRRTIFQFRALCCVDVT